MTHVTTLDGQRTCGVDQGYVLTGCELHRLIRPPVKDYVNVDTLHVPTIGVVLPLSITMHAASKKKLINLD